MIKEEIMYLFTVLALSAVIIGISWYFRQKKDEQLRSEGKIIKRGLGFMEKAEVFLLDLDNPDQVTKGLQGFPYSEMEVSIKSDAAKQYFQFSNPYGWNARLYCVENRNSRATYRFEYLDWKENKGMVQGGLYMNMLQTAVEKMFLNIDPNTRIREELLNTTTKHKFF